MIRRLFSGLWQAVTVTKNALGNIIFLLLLGIIITAMFTGETDVMPDSTALVIDPSGVIVEQKELIDPFSRFILGDDSDQTETALRDIKDAIEEGADDDRITALVLRLDRIQGAGLSKLEDIARSITLFKETGKPVFAFGGGYSQGQYYLASMADEVYLDKSSYPVFSGVFLPGFGVYPVYFKSALDKLNIKFNVYKVGTYKGAVEPYLRDDMSEASKLANLTWLDALWANYRTHITGQRGMSETSFAAYTNQYNELLAASNGDGNQLAIQHGLVDDLLSNEEWQTRVSDIVGKQGDTFSQTNFRQYLTMIRPPVPIINPATNKIAIITASGTILDGNQPPGEIGSTTTVEMINRAHQDHSVKAIVLRVDSPGGSATASEEIRQALVRVQKDGKPVVVSMGSYAASGGYWISASSNKIFANANTLTGSIGTFLTFPSVKIAANNLGVYSDGVGTTKMTNLLNPLEDVPDILDDILQQSINNTYKRFVSLVAEGREMTFEQADTVAQGRVWAAKDALDHGLIDAIGSMEDAIASAALLADVGSYDIWHVKPPLSLRDQFLQQVANSKTVDSLIGPSSIGVSSSRLLSLIKSEFETLLNMSQQPGVYVQCIYCKISL
jgi:protease-4